MYSVKYVRKQKTFKVFVGEIFKAEDKCPFRFFNFIYSNRKRKQL